MGSAIWLLLMLWVATAQADDTRVHEANGIRYTVSYAWPSTLGKGYWPLWVRVENTRPTPAMVNLELVGWMTEARVEQSLRLDAGSSATVDMLFPALFKETATANLRVTATDSLPETLTSLGPSDQAGGDSLAALLVQDVGSGSPAAQHIQSLYDLHSPGGVASTDGQHLPTTYQAYTSLDLVVLDGVMPTGDAGKALWTWVRMGGQVVVIGEPALLANESEPADWMDTRFQHDGRWRMGLGYVAVLDPYNPGAGRIVTDRWGPAPMAIPRTASSYSSALIGEDIVGFADLGLVPVAAFSILLIGVALLMGPVNFAVLSLLRRPQWLLFSIPVLSIGSTGLIVSYALFSQGTDTKQGGFAMAVLDQRNHRVMVQEVRGLFVGMASGNGLRPGSGTGFFPHVPEIGFRYRAVQGEGGRLTGDMLPARQAVVHTVLSEQAERRRLEIEQDEQGVMVHSGFDVDVIDLVYVDADGDAFRLSEGTTLNAGDSQVLVSSMDRHLEHARVPSDWPIVNGEQMVHGSYRALVKGTPFGDDAGLETTPIETWTMVVGILEEGS